MSEPTKSETLYCSFCGKSQYEVRKLIAGPQSFICNECVEICSDVVHEDQVNRLAKWIASPIIAVMRFFRGKRGEGWV